MDFVIFILFSVLLLAVVAGSVAVRWAFRRRWRSRHWLLAPWCCMVALLGLVGDGIRRYTLAESLTIAVREDNMAKARFLLKLGADPNGSTEFGVPLLNAAAAGHSGAVRLFITRGAQVDLADPQGNTALGLALHYRRHEVAAILRQAGAKAWSVSPDARFTYHQGD